MTSSNISSPKISWVDAAQTYLRPQTIALMFLGFAAGLPFLLVFSTLTLWLSDEGVTKSSIGLFAWVGTIYAVKVVWAPVVDRLVIPFLTATLGKRRSWILMGQLGIGVGLVLMSVVGTDQLIVLAICALLVAFSSATQDIAIDAYRIEIADDRFQGALSASYIFGYRLALLVAGAGALYIAEYFDWVVAYQSMASLTFVGIITVLLIKEPNGGQSVTGANGETALGWRGQFFESVVAPFMDFFRRHKQFALTILVFIAVYRLSDIAMGIMANPFYRDMGYSKTDIANIAKVFGFFMTILGSVIGGLLVVKWRIMPCLLIGAVAVAVTNLLFAALSLSEPTTMGLALVISADNLSGGFASVSFIAYLSSLTNKAYTATQYALFSSLMNLPGKFLSGFSGFVVDGFGFFTFFVVAAGLGIPAILLVLYLMRRGAETPPQNSEIKDPSHTPAS